MKSKIIPSEDIFILVVLLILIVASLSFIPLKMYKEKYSYTNIENNSFEKPRFESTIFLEYLAVLILLIVILRIESEKIISKKIIKFIKEARR